MRNLTIKLAFCTILSIFALESFAQEVTLLVDKRGLISKKDCFAKIAVCDSLGQTNPSHKVFYSTRDIYLVVTSEGDWQLDSKFIDEILPRFTFYQNVDAYKPLNRRAVIENSKIAKIVIAISRIIDVTQPFQVALTVDNANQMATFNVPVTLWPNYEKYLNEFKSAKTEDENGKILASFTSLSAILKYTDLQKYPFFSEITDYRIQIYSDYFQDIISEFNKIQIDQNLTAKQRRPLLENLLLKYSFLQDSLTYIQSPGSDKLDEIKQNAAEKQSVLLKYLDGLSADIDFENIEWLKNAAPDDHRFRFMVECLYALMRAQNIDSAWNSSAKLPDTTYADLDNFTLRETFESLMRVMDKNYKEGKPLFPPQIFYNISQLKGTYKQPIISVIQMTAYFYEKNMDFARNYLRLALSASSDMTLNQWLSGIAANIKFNNASIPPEIKKLSDDGMKLVFAGDFDGAMQKFQRADYISPNTSLIAYDMAVLNLVKNDTLKAITYFERALAFDSTMTEIYRRLYNLYITQKSWNNAIKVLETALHIEDAWEFRFFLAYCYMQKGAYNDAILQIDAALILNQKNYDQYILQGDAYKALGDKSKAIEKYSQAKFLEPDRNEAYERLRTVE